MRLPSITFLIFLFLIFLAHHACFAQTDLNSSNKNPVTIAIDPGHPSETSRGCAHHGLTELQIVWNVALKLERLIKTDPSLKSIKTKNEVDQTVTNRRRAEIANEAKAALMVRLHCDSGKGTGCTVYYPDQQGTTQGVTGPSLEVIAASAIAAEYMQQGLAETLGNKLMLNPIKTDSVTYVGSKQGALTGSIFSEVPALVVEMVYLNNASDAAFIGDAANQELIAHGIYKGIRKFIDRKK